MRFFIDRSLGSQGVAQALRNAGARVEVHDDHFAVNEQDTVWLAEIVFYDSLKNQYFPIYVMPGESLEQKRSSYDTGAYDYLTEYTL